MQGKRPREPAGRPKAGGGSASTFQKGKRIADSGQKKRRTEFKSASELRQQQVAPGYTTLIEAKGGNCNVFAVVLSYAEPRKTNGSGIYSNNLKDTLVFNSLFLILHRYDSQHKTSRPLLSKRPGCKSIRFAQQSA